MKNEPPRRKERQEIRVSKSFCVTDKFLKLPLHLRLHNQNTKMVQLP
ncbi:MAG: hypothetical protein RMZ41_004945 [Nostoc sp. DedVER02]